MPLEAIKDFFDLVLGQGELLGSWALGVFGGCVVFIAWYVRSATEPGQSLKVRWLPLVLSAVIAEGVAVLLTYIAYGQLIGVEQQALVVHIVNKAQFYEVLGSHGFADAQYLFVSQSVTFFLGVVLLVIFALGNYSLLNRKAPSAQSRPLSNSNGNVT